MCFLYDTRLRFLVEGKDEGRGAPMSCAIVYWGRDYERFKDEFVNFGAVVSLTEMRGREVGGVGGVWQAFLSV